MPELTPELREYQKQEHKRIRVKLYRRWIDQPEDFMKGNAVIAHGYRGNVRAQHFKDLANSFDNADFNVVSFDLPNFGKSRTLHPELEGQIVSFALLVRSFKSALFAMLDSKSKSRVPTVLVGYSIGALVILRLLQIYPYLQKYIAGIVLIATPLRVDHNARKELLRWKKVVRPLFKLLVRVRPRMSVAEYEVDEFSKDDPHHFKGAMNAWTANQILIASESAREPKNLKKITVPILFVHGTDDATAPIVEMENAYEEVATVRDDKDKIIYPNIDHLVLQKHSPAIQDILKWCNIRMRLAGGVVAPKQGRVEEHFQELIDIILDASRRLLRLTWNVLRDILGGVFRPFRK